MHQKKEKLMLVLSMCIFSTIGILRRYIPYSSGFVAMVRGFCGASFLLVVLLLRGGRPDLTAIQKNAAVLLLSGTAIGLNWIFLFEAYRFTTVAIATLCYYLAPILVILASPIVLKEKLTLPKILCTLAAMTGIVLVSGVGSNSLSGAKDLTGILFGLAAAVLYASVMLLNRKLGEISCDDRTIAQLIVASAILLPYVLLTDDFSAMVFSPVPVLLLLVAGIVHTGIAYWMYFGAIGTLNSQTTALFSYIDPIGAILLSVLLLREPLSLGAGIGAVLILGAAICSERI